MFTRTLLILASSFSLVSCASGPEHPGAPDVAAWDEVAALAPYRADWSEASSIELEVRHRVPLRGCFGGVHPVPEEATVRAWVRPEGEGWEQTGGPGQELRPQSTPDGSFRVGEAIRLWLAEVDTRGLFLAPVAPGAYDGLSPTFTVVIRVDGAHGPVACRLEVRERGSGADGEPMGELTASLLVLFRLR